MSEDFSVRAVGTNFSPAQGNLTLGAGRKASARPGELAPAFYPPRKQRPVAFGRFCACGAVVLDTTACTLFAALVLLAAHLPSPLGSRNARLQERTTRPLAASTTSAEHEALLLCKCSSARACTCLRTIWCNSTPDQAQGPSYGPPVLDSRLSTLLRFRLCADHGVRARAHTSAISCMHERVCESERDVCCANCSGCMHPDCSPSPGEACSSNDMCSTQPHAPGPPATLLSLRVTIRFVDPQLDAG